MTEPNINSDQATSLPIDSAAIDHRVRELRAAIGDLAMAVDTHKTKVAGGVGGGVFLFMLAGLATYDLVNGKAGLWLSLGITRDLLLWLAMGLGLAALVAFAYALRLEKNRDHERDEKLQAMEQELQRLLHRQ
ncbi:MAG: hypothetical protein HY231_21935 [Acidobacteria bacterium]|nr:hypothetical protein [Acidobacteriota bacterium]